MSQSAVYKCGECGSTSVSWSISLHNRSGVVDGRLCLRDVGASLVLSCDECSATLLLVGADGNEGLELLARIGEPRPRTWRTQGMAT